MATVVVGPVTDAATQVLPRPGGPLARHVLASVTAVGTKIVVELRPDGGEVRDQIVSAAVGNGMGVLEFSAEKVSLEEIFLAIVGPTGTTEAAAS